MIDREEMQPRVANQHDESFGEQRLLGEHLNLAGWFAKIMWTSPPRPGQPEVNLAATSRKDGAKCMRMLHTNQQTIHL